MLCPGVSDNVVQQLPDRSKKNTQFRIQCKCFQFRSTPRQTLSHGVMKILRKPVPFTLRGRHKLRCQRSDTVLTGAQFLLGI
jgi:hypothetical protein